MRESSYFILAALMDDRLHGYAIIKRAEELSGGRVRLAAGTLYATLDRLVTQEYVVADGEAVVNGRARRYYSLTEAGSVLLREQAMRMAAAAKVVTDRPAGTLPSARRAGDCMTRPMMMSTTTSWSSGCWPAVTGRCWGCIRGDTGPNEVTRSSAPCLMPRMRASDGRAGATPPA